MDYAESLRRNFGLGGSAPGPAPGTLTGATPPGLPAEDAYARELRRNARAPAVPTTPAALTITGPSVPSPEDAATALRASRRLNIAPSLALSDPARMGAHEQAALFERLAQQSPAVARTLAASSPHVLLMARDDLPAVFEFGPAMAALRRAKADAGGMGPIPPSQPAGTLSNAIRGLGTTARQVLPQAARGAATLFADIRGDTEASLRQQGRIASAEARIARATPDFTGAAPPAPAGGAEVADATLSLVYGGAQSVIHTTPGFAAGAAGFLAGGPLAGLVAGLGTLGAQTLFTQYGTFRARGAPAGEAALGALVMTALEVGTELTPARWLVSRFGRDRAKQLVAGYLMRDVAPEQVNTFLQGLTDVQVTGSPQTMAQYLTAENLGWNALQTLVGTGMASAAIGGLSSAVQSSFRDEQRAETARAAHAALSDITRLAAATKVLNRDRETLASFLQEVAVESGAPTTLYVDANTLSQEMVTALNAAIPELSAQQDELVTGGIVALPVGSLATAVTGTPLEQQLLPLLRVDPNGFSSAEAEVFYQEQLARFEQAAEENVQAARTDDAFATSLAEVRKAAERELARHSGRPASETRLYAAVAEALYGQLARRAGMTPEAAWKEFGFDVGREQDPNAVLSQAPTRPAATRSDFAPGAVVDLLERENWAVMTGANPDGQAATAEFNAAANARMRDQLLRDGYETLDVVGKYGNVEPGFVVLGITPEAALRYAQEYQQESVLTRYGLLYRDGTVNPSIQVTEFDAEPEDFYSTIPELGTRFQVELDFDQRVPLSERLQQTVNVRQPSVPSLRKNVFTEEELLSASLVDIRRVAPGYADSVVRRLQDPYHVSVPADIAAIQDPVEAQAALTRYLADNLEWLYNITPEEYREVSRLWYYGGHQITAQWAREFGTTHDVTAGVVAALSPKQAWPINMYQARRVLEITSSKAITERAWSPAMTRKMNEIFSGAVFEDGRRAIKGKRFTDLEFDLHRAMWVRIYDETHNDRHYAILSPEGYEVGHGGTATWAPLESIANAVAIAVRGTDHAVLSASLGAGHKVRSFYMNLRHPENQRQATIDTHANGGALLVPYSANDIASALLFGSGIESTQRDAANYRGPGAPGSAIAGAKGTYPLVHDAYVLAAQRLGLPPMELQSIVWETVKGLFEVYGRQGKKKLRNRVEAIWKEHRDGRIGTDEARRRVLDAATGGSGRVAPPSWAGADRDRTARGEPLADGSQHRGIGLPIGYRFVGPGVTGRSRADRGGAGRLQQTGVAEYAPRREGESGTDYAKRAVDATAAVTSLPEQFGRYFDLPAEPVLAPLGVLTATKPPDQRSAANAAKRMRAAAAGALPKREPIRVRLTAEGRYEVLDGNATLQAAKSLGWSGLPVQIVEREGLDAYAQHPDLQLLTEEARTELLRLYRLALDAKPGFDTKLYRAAFAVGGTPKAAPLKGAVRTVEKILLDYGGRASEIKDLLRGSVVIDDLRTVSRTVEQITEAWPGAQVKRNLLVPHSVPMDNGYRDVFTRADLGSGLWSEVQILLTDMAAAKDATGHDLYKQARTIEGRAFDENRDLTLDEATQVAALARQQFELYEPLWLAALAHANGTVSNLPRTAAEKSETDTSRRSVVLEPGKGRGGSVSKARSEPLPSPVGTNATGTSSSTNQNLSPGPNRGSLIVSTSDVSLPRHGTERPDGVSVVGVHFAPATRTVLHSSRYGEGMRGAERTRVDQSFDARLRERVHFYVDTGGGVTPEAGVGAQVHAVRLEGLYDVDADPLNLWTEAGPLNAKESAILDAGFTGYVTRAREQGTAVLLGVQTVEVRHLGKVADVLTQPDGTVVRGEVVFRPDPLGPFARISFLADANKSTFFHEMAHVMLEAYTEIARRPNAPPDIVADLNAILRWSGFKGDEITGLTPLQQWLRAPVSLRREYHERFARGFEAYLREGRAPNTELRRAFATFRRWLRDIYQRLIELDVQLSDDIRGVMDRMIASQDAIEAAERERALLPLIASAEELGMPETEWANYQRLYEDQREAAFTELHRRVLRNMQWVTKARDRETRKLAREADAHRKVLRAEVTEEVHSEPVHAARRFLAQGLLPEGTKVTGAKLSMAALREMYGSEANALWRYLPTNIVTTNAAEALHPDEVASMFGFRSGDQLVRDLLASPSPAEDIEGRTEQRMLEEYGDLVDADAVSAAVDAALANEVRGRFLAAELAAVTKAQHPARLLARAAQDWATALIGRKRIRDLRPGTYTAAANREGKAAEAALAKADQVLVATHKRNQMLQHYAGREASAALEEVQRSVKYLRKFDQAKAPEGLDASYLDQIHTILERYELKRLTARELDVRASLPDWIAQLPEPLRDAVALPDHVLDASHRTPYQNLTLDEFRGVVESVQVIEHLGRLKHRLLTAKDKAEFRERVDGMIVRLTENARPDVTMRVRSGVGPAIAEATRIGLAAHRKFASLIREMDGGTEGPLWETLIRTMNDRSTWETEQRHRVALRLIEMFAAIRGQKFGGQGEVVPGTNLSLNREERIAVVLNAGNAGNLQRLLNGQQAIPGGPIEPWSVQDVQAVVNSLSKAEMDFVQQVWDLMASYRPQVAAKEKRVTGKEPEWVTATPVVTPHGTYRGGYFPITYDPNQSVYAAAHADAEAAREQLQGAMRFATTRRSHTKERADQVLARPLMLSFDAISNGLHDVVHDLAWHEWLIDANRIMRDRAFSSAVNQHYGPEVYDAMKRGIENIARDGRASETHALDPVLNHIRYGFTVSRMAWSITTAMVNLTGFLQGFQRVSPQWYLHGLAEFMGSPARMVETTALVHQKSPFMAARPRTLDREANEIMNNITAGETAAGRGFRSSLWWLIAKTQLIVDLPIWLGAYKREMAANPDDEVRAIAIADQAVRDTQGGGQVADLARIQQGASHARLFTALYSYFNATHNLLAESYRLRTKKSDYVGLAGDYLLLLTAPAMLAVAIRVLMSALAGEEWDEEKLVKAMAAEQLGFVLGTNVVFRELNVAATNLTGLSQFGTDYSGPAALTLVSDVTRLGQQINQGEADAALFRALISTAGVVFHLPSAQINRSLAGGYAFAQGEAALPAVLFGPPRD